MKELKELVMAAGEILGGALSESEGAWELEVLFENDRSKVVLIEEATCDLEAAQGQPLVRVAADILEMEEGTDIDAYCLLVELPSLCFARPYVDEENSVISCDAVAFLEGLDAARLAAIILQVAAVADRMEDEITVVDGEEEA
jgi:hypothetical protein